MIHSSKKLKSSLKRLKIYINKNIVIFSFFVLISLTFFRCANMQRPTGGPKDSIPPKILLESPANYTRNFKAKEIKITFDEFIKFNSHFKEFSISPDLDKQPDYKIKKKDLIIKLPDPLETNTTYTINFGKGLVDYNESNPIINYTYVFSTGPELDSLQVSGKVTNAYTKRFDPTDDKDVKVLLIPTRQDSIFGKKKANIFTTVDTAGTFTFKNLREDTYRIYALKEANNDRIYNHPDESLGFIADSIILNADVNNIHIEFSKGKPQLFRTTEKKIEKNGRILLTFNQPVDTPQLTVIDPISLDANKKINYSVDKDSAFVFVEKLDFDSIKFQLKNNLTVLDTILLRRNKNEKYERFIEPKLNISNKVDKTKHIRISSTFPIESIDKNKITLNEDSISRRNFQIQKDSIQSNLYHLKFNWRPNKNYELVLQEKSIISLFDVYNKESKHAFTLDESDNYGDIYFDITGLDSNINYIVQLINEKKDVIFDNQLLYNTNKLNYIKFPGGKYTLRIIADLNRNNRWDASNYYTKEQAEPIWYLDKTFTIRANWEQNEKITVQFK